MNGPLPIRGWVESVRGHRTAVALVILSSLVMAGVVTRTLTPVYESKASFYSPLAADLFSLTSDPGGPLRAAPTPSVFREQLRAYFEILVSERLATRVAENLGVTDLREIRRRTRFRLTTSGIFAVTGVHPDPKMAARIANTYADTFNEFFEEISLPRIQRTRTFVESQLAKVRSELSAADERVRLFEEQHRAVSLGEETSELIKQVSAVQAQADQTKVSLGEVRARRISLERQVATETRMQVSAEVTRTNPLVEQIQARLVQLEIEAAGLAARVTPPHPDMVRVRRQIEEARQQLSQELTRILGDQTTALNPVHENLRQTLVNLYAEEQGLAAKAAGLDQVVQQLEARMLLLPAMAAELSSLRREVRHLEETERLLALRLADARIQEQREIQTFLIVDRALPGEAPAYPSLLLNLAAAGGLGVVAGVFYALFLGYLDRRRQGAELPLMEPRSVLRQGT